MNFDVERCRSLMLSATLAELTASKPFFQQLPGYESGSSECRVPISGISLNVSPWHGDVSLSLRDQEAKWDERTCYTPAEWKYEFLGLPDRPSVREIDDAIAYLSTSYGAVGRDSHKARETAHLIFLAAAEALLDHSVTALLRTYQIDAPFIDDDFLPHRCFEYIVTDQDNSIAGNYCEIVVASRITQRLKGRIER
jgi:hypothetical protein